MDSHAGIATTQRKAPGGASTDRVFFGTAALLFASSAAVTIVWSASMPAMDGMRMPGGWTMPMAWMRMPGQTWIDVAATFLGMWFVMMVAMMMPSLVPMLRRYRQDVRSTGEMRVGPLTVIVGAGYFFTWLALGAVVFPLGAMLATLSMQLPEVARAVPLATGVVVMLAGALQFSEWKRRHLACCRTGTGRGSAAPANASMAWRHGLRLGLHCCQCCAGPVMVLLVTGVMDPFMMIIVTVAITAERLASAGARIADVVGVLSVGAGLVFVATAVLTG